MKLLFLDDMQVRHAAFRVYAAEFGVVDIDHAYNAEQAVNLLETNEYAAAFLDCDLAEEHYERMYLPGMDHSGRHVARWIANNGKPKLVIIHSYNPPGAQEMWAIIRNRRTDIEVVKAPFGPEGMRHILAILLSKEVEDAEVEDAKVE